MAQHRVEVALSAAMPPRVAARICRLSALFSDPRCSNCIVHGTLARGNVSDAGLEGVLRRSEHQHLPAKGTLYAENAPAEHVFMLRQGSLKLLREGLDGEPRMVRWMKAGATAGLEAVLEPRYRTSAVALEPVEVCRVPLPVLHHLESAGGSFYLELMRHWQAHLDASDDLFAKLGSGPTHQRLARLLIVLCENECPSLPRSDIGAALGVSMETASRLMAEFRRQGAIRCCGRHLVCDSEALRALARLAEPKNSPYSESTT